MQLFTDNPIDSTKQDAFGFKRYAEFLKDTILQTKPPFCVGIFGPWGSGKTSFMNMLQELIEESGVKTIEFNPWKYDEKEDLWHALIQTILNHIADDPETEDKEAAKKAKELAIATTWLALKKAITALTAGVITESNLDEVIKAFNEKEKMFYQHINQFEDDFADVVTRYCGDGGKLVIFIDDLDRCLPENAITVLESLKLYMGRADCIFVLGIDHYVVEEGIRHRYGDKIRVSGRDYLDKIIQIPFYIPQVPYKKLRNSLQDLNLTLPEEIWNIIQVGMAGNVRKTRRFINSFILLRRFLENPDIEARKTLRNITSIARTQEMQDIFLARLLVLQMSFTDFYHHLRLYPGDWYYLERRIIRESRTERQQEALKDRERLEQFWKDTSLVAFISTTSEHSQAPDGDVVSLLLQATNLVAEISDSKLSDAPPA